ncbi:MAG: hypothetical protein V3R29_12380, partial [Candidatus Acidoferrales bacterium]
LEQQIGSLEAGKRADLILVRRQAPHAVPAYDVYSQIVYSLKASDVETSFIHGRLVMWEGAVLTLDPRLILQRARQYGQAVRETLRRER